MDLWIKNLDDICKKLADLPLSDQCEIAPPPTSPITNSIFLTSYLSSACDKADLGIDSYFQQNQITAGIELARLKL